MSITQSLGEKAILQEARSKDTWRQSLYQKLFAVPNTLCHIAIQTPINGLAFGKQPLLWVIVGCILPDVPWIVLKSLIALQLFNPFDLRLYCTAQASLFFCLFLSGFLASFTKQSGRIFLILAGNCLFHLLLDTVEVKWGNGVHLIAPFSWTMLQFDKIWSESSIVLVLSGLGFVFLLVFWRTLSKTSLQLQLPSKIKAGMGLACLACYLAGPLLFLDQMEAVNVYNIHTLRLKSERPGKEMTFDRASYLAEQKTLKTFYGEAITVVGNLPTTSGRVSFRGHFLTPDIFYSESSHLHTDKRDFASLLGLFMACTLLLQSLLVPKLQAYKNNRKNHAI